MAAYLAQSRIEGRVVLSPEETSFLHGKLAPAQAQAAQLKAQIDELNRQYEAKLTEISSIHNVLAPVRRIPCEILSIVFLELCLGRKHWRRQNGYPQLVVAQVCSHWRTVAHTTPCIWTRLLHWIGEKQSQSEHAGSMMTEWLQRSGTALPLHVDLFFFKDETGPYTDDLLIRLGPFCHRLRSLHLVVPVQHLFPFFARCSFPTLETLDLSLGRLEHPTLGHMFRVHLTTFSNSRRLEDLSIKGEAVFPDAESVLLQSIAFPTKQLRSLRYSLGQADRDPSPFLSFLHSCSTLVECTLKCDEWSRDPNLQLLPVFLPTLRSLTLWQWDDDSEARFIQLITAPSLRFLCIDHSEFGGDDPTDLSEHLIDLQSRSSAPLETLHLNRTRSMPALDLLSVLAVFPTIKRLRLFGCNLNTLQMMQGLRITENNPCLLRRLESLEMTDLDMRPKGAETYIASMVESRTRSPPSEDGNGNDCGLHAEDRVGVARLDRLMMFFEEHRLNDDVIKRLEDCRLSWLNLDDWEY